MGRRLLIVAAAVAMSTAPWAQRAQQVRPDPRPPGVDVGLDLAGHLASARSLPARLERCQALVDGLVAAGLPGASAAVVLPDGELHTFVAGNTQREGGRPLTPADRLLVGSTGKTFVTAVAHRLLADGLLELDAPIADLYADEPHPPAWLDTLAGAREFTLRQLLRHETGLARYVYVEDFHRTLSSEPDRVWKPEELVAFVADAPPLFAPGEGWAYSDTNYLVVGMLIEHVTGRTFYDLTQEHVLEPLALNDTVPTDSRSIPGLVQGEVIGGRTLGVGEWLLEDGQATYNLQFEWCGGGFASTPADLARWAAALFGGRALAGDDDGAYLGTLLDAVDAPGLWPGTRYGLGVMLRDSAAGPMQFHDGFMPGHLTTLAWYPELGVGAALQVNTDDARALGRPRFEILAELAKTAITPP